jgi:hypothetical protein
VIRLTGKLRLVLVALLWRALGDVCEAAYVDGHRRGFKLGRRTGGLKLASAQPAAVASVYEAKHAKAG